MILLMVISYGYEASGPALHELAGFGFLALFSIHVGIHWRWFTTLLKGRYNPQRKLNTAFTLSAGAAFAMVVTSGSLNSELLGTQTPLLGRAWHVIPAYWLLITMALHFGVHWRTLYNGLGRRFFSRTATMNISGTGRYLFAALCVYGLYGFSERRIFEKLLGWSSYDFWPIGHPVLLFFIQYIAIIAVLSVIGHYSFKALQKKRRARG